MKNNYQNTSLLIILIFSLCNVTTSFDYSYFVHKSANFIKSGADLTSKLIEEIQDKTKYISQAAEITSSFIVERVECPFGECCVDAQIYTNFGALKATLNKELYGQPIVIEYLKKALDGHYQQIDLSRKPLVLSFQGPPGTGKTYVTDYLADHIYKKGTNSKFVHKFMGRIDFSDNSRVVEYQQAIKKRIMAAVKKCPRSMFIFDEVEKMPAKIFEQISSLLDYNRDVQGNNYRHAIFIFISNGFGEQIGMELASLMSRGVLRDDVKLTDFQEQLELISYNDGGLKGSSLINSHLIDFYIPFLPLEKRHVERCIRREFERLNIDPEESIVQKILADHTTYNEYNFSKAGCKRLDKAVSIYANHN